MIHSSVLFASVLVQTIEEKRLTEVGFYVHSSTHLDGPTQKATQLFLRLRSLLVTNADKDVLSDASSFRRFRKDSRVI